MSQDQEKGPASLDSVMRQLDELKQTRPADSSSVTPSGDAARIAIDFASASAVGCMLGFGLDWWLGTSPWGLIGGLFIGCAAGTKMMFAAMARDEKRDAAAKKNETTNKQD